MTIMESAIALNNDYIACDNNFNKISLFIEHSRREYEINLKEAALKVLKENGTEEDYNFLVTEAEENFAERVKKAVEKIIETLKEFIERCKDSLVKLVTGDRATEAVDKLDEACKKNKNFADTKIEYNNTDNQIGILEEGIEKIKKKVSKVKSGNGSEDDIEDIREIESSTMKRVAAAAIATTVTLAVGIGLFKKFNSKSEIENVPALNGKVVTDKLKVCIVDDGVESKVNAEILTDAAQVMSRLEKEKASRWTAKITSLFKAIKDAVPSEKLESTDDVAELEDLDMFAYINEYAESFVEEDDYDDVYYFDDEEVEDEEPVAESVGVEEGLDLDQYFEEMCNDIFGESEESEEVTEESTDDTRDMTEVYMEQLEHELFGEEEEVETEASEDEEVETESAELSIESLLDEMENLL